MSNTIAEDYRKFRETSGYCVPPGKAACALRSARVLAEWRKAEKAGLVRLRAEEEQESYFDAYGKPEDEKECESIIKEIERNGCWRVISEVRTGGDCWRTGSEYWKHWEHADSVGMCVGYENPLDPFQNDYVIDMMRAALALIPQEGEH
jgi:hypothetical protein